MLFVTQVIYPAWNYFDSLIVSDFVFQSETPRFGSLTILLDQLSLKLVNVPLWSKIDMLMLLHM